MPNTVMEERRFISKVDGYEDRYLIEYPKEEMSGPLVFFLHAGLSHAEQAFCEDYDWCFRKLRDDILRRDGAYVAPEYRGDSWMNAAAEEDTTALIVEKKLEFQARHVILVGASMGATSAMILAAHNPDLIDGVIAICPATDMRQLYDDLNSREALIYKQIAQSIADAYGGTPEEVPSEYEYRSAVEFAHYMKMPIVIRHGEEDEIIDISHSMKMIDLLRVHRTPVKFEIIHGGDHDSVTVDVPWTNYIDFLVRMWELKEAESRETESE